MVLVIETECPVKTRQKKCVFGCHKIPNILCSLGGDTYPLPAGGIQTNVRGKSCGIGTFIHLWETQSLQGDRGTVNSTDVESDPWLHIQTLLLLDVVCWAGPLPALTFSSSKGDTNGSLWLDHCELLLH